MKTRAGFVSNSSSTSFYIYNKTSEPLPLVEFVKENIYLVDKYNTAYNWKGYTHDMALAAVTNYKDILQPGENICTFGDEHGNVLGEIYDYILQDGGSSERFSWTYLDSNR